jgi:hypothetical protein
LTIIFTFRSTSYFEDFRKEERRNEGENNTTKSDGLVKSEVGDYIGNGSDSAGVCIQLLGPLLMAAS